MEIRVGRKELSSQTDRESLKFGRRNNVQYRRPEVPSATYKEAELNEAPVSFVCAPRACVHVCRSRSRVVIQYYSQYSKIFEVSLLDDSTIRLARKG